MSINLDPSKYTPELICKEAEGGKYLNKEGEFVKPDKGLYQSISWETVKARCIRKSIETLDPNSKGDINKLSKEMKKAWKDKVITKDLEEKKLSKETKDIFMKIHDSVLKTEEKKVGSSAG